MEAKLNEKSNTLTITIPLDPKGRPSASGKTTVHASSKGNQPTEVVLNGRPLVIGVNAYTRN